MPVALVIGARRQCPVRAAWVWIAPLPMPMAAAPILLRTAPPARPPARWYHGSGSPGLFFLPLVSAAVDGRQFGRRLDAWFGPLRSRDWPRCGGPLELDAGCSADLPGHPELAGRARLRGG